MVRERDEDLGMHRPITRRDFVNGSAMALAASAGRAARTDAGVRCG
jgi:hypothetical protein